MSTTREKDLQAADTTQILTDLLVVLDELDHRQHRIHDGHAMRRAASQLASKLAYQLNIDAPAPDVRSAFHTFSEVVGMEPNRKD